MVILKYREAVIGGSIRQDTKRVPGRLVKINSILGLMKKALIPQISASIILLIINLVIVWPWFGDGYPPVAASMEPTIIAQARFLSLNWPGSGWNRYWYLGFPFRLAGSPLLPYVLALVSRIFPQASLWFGYRLVTGLALILMPVGIFWLVNDLAGSKSFSKTLISFLSALFFTFLPAALYLFPQVFKIGRQAGFFPWQYFSLAYLGNGTKALGLVLLPVCLLTIDGYLKGKLKRAFWPSGLICLLALTDLSSVVSLVILTVLLLVSYSMSGRLGKKIDKSLKVFALCFLLLSFYYTPRFWWQALSAPSLAGKRALSVVLLLSKTISILMAMILAVISAKFLKKEKSYQFLFVFLWVFVFSLLSLVRFLADADFWQDYTNWGVELGMGIVVFLAFWLAKLGGKRPALFLAAVVILSSSLLWLSSRNKLLSPRLIINNTVEYQVTDWLVNNLPPEERIFLSGSPVFWASSLADLAQVRGGTDKAATHPFWDHAAYQIRIGSDGDLAYQWLKALGVSWIVVHGRNSQEPYRDFVYPEKFQGGKFQEVWEKNGDAIYKIEVGIARQLKDPNRLLKLKAPRDGADKQAVSDYNSCLGNFLPFRWINSNQLVIRAPFKGAVSLAITYDSGWQAWQGNQRLTVKKDMLGQTVIFSETEGDINLKYQKWGIDNLAGVTMSLIGLISLMRKRKIFR